MGILPLTSSTKVFNNFPLAWVGVKNFGFTEKQKKYQAGVHVCIVHVQKKMAAWRAEVP